MMTSIFTNAVADRLPFAYNDNPPGATTDTPGASETAEIVVSINSVHIDTTTLSETQVSALVKTMQSALAGFRCAQPGEIDPATAIKASGV